MRLILASSSPRRRELLARLGKPFDVIKPDIDETQRPNEDPFDYVHRLSREKAAAVATSVETMMDDPVTVLAADTIVLDTNTDSGEILIKPDNADDARTTLQRLRGCQHIVCTAFTIHHIDGQALRPTIITRDARTTVTMRDYTDYEINAYIATGDPFDKAGSYAIQHPGFAPVESIEGDYDNVVGLPTDAVRQALREVGWPV